MHRRLSALVRWSRALHERCNASDRWRNGVVRRTNAIVRRTNAIVRRTSAIVQREIARTGVLSRRVGRGRSREGSEPPRARPRSGRDRSRRVRDALFARLVCPTDTAGPWSNHGPPPNLPPRRGAGGPPCLSVGSSGAPSRGEGPRARSAAKRCCPFERLRGDVSRTRGPTWRRSALEVAFTTRGGRARSRTRAPWRS